jgi:hypothetical protein
MSYTLSEELLGPALRAAELVDDHAKGDEADQQVRQVNAGEEEVVLRLGRRFLELPD